jgi:hypothetical protein
MYCGMRSTIDSMEDSPVNESVKYVAQERVSCDVCLKEVPYTDAQHDECSDFMYLLAQCLQATTLGTELN